MEGSVGDELRLLCLGEGNYDKAVASIFMLAVMPFLETGCGTESVFDGSRLSDASGFLMEYSILNREESADLNLTEGDRLKVSLSHTEGSVDVMEYNHIEWTEFTVT